MIKRRKERLFSGGIMRNLLIVVDMVNGFINEGALADKRINQITPAIISKIEAAKRAGVPIIAFKDCHKEDDEEFKLFPPHCIKGTSESELIDELKPYEKDMIIIEKDTTNGFNTKEMRKILSENYFDNIDITGCCTDICVSGLAQSLVKYFNQNNIKTQIHVSADCVDTFSNPEHDADKINAETLKEFEEMGIKVNYENKLKPIKIRKLTDRRFLNMFEVTYQGENGEIRYEMVTRRKLPEVIEPSLNPDAIHVIPYSYVNGKMVVYLIKEFRYAIGDYVYAVPAGLVDEGESGRESAIRELNEEIGAEVVNIERTETSSYSSVGMTDERAEMYEAEVRLKGKQNLVGNERIDVVPVKLEEVDKLLDEEKFGARSKYALRSFVYKQKIKELERQVKALEEKLDESEKGE